MANKVLSGGAGLKRALANLSNKVAKGGTLKVGFLEGATYPTGVPVATVAAAQEFGATINVEERTQTVYRKTGKDGGFLRNGRFVKARESNFATDHTVGAHTIVIPPRPFFRNMIAQNEGSWGAALGAALKSSGYDAGNALEIVGEAMVEQLQDSIRDTKGPPNAKSTVAKKGFDNPLIDTGHMLNSVGKEVET